MDRLQGQIEKMLRPYYEFQKSIEPTIRLQKSLEQSLKGVQKSFVGINDIYASMTKIYNPVYKYLETFKEIGELLKDYTENIPRDLLLIAQYGWFIEIDDMNLPNDVVSKINENKIDEANEILVNYYKSNLDRIFEELIDRHDNRKEIFIQIFNSFKSENYNVLIPCTLSQVDGICFDFTKKKFFIKEKANNFLPQVTSELEKSAGYFTDLYLTPIQNKTPIMAQEKDIIGFPCHLNRHEILHGISTDYGTEINSLKVISLLKYLSDLLCEIDLSNDKQ